ncbi:expressed unknown protein [Seminavis robusta]|uniref:Uncharacterized protein n=1 Tax=Seminavis robusta TaxID=568900 RepID=A0A9N8HK19_9STRA|nr:expressed unknown protein [Seminavis robusta]|eukprot:Sro700_g189580.1 n/a (432) ;mRNA; f:5599-6894
MSDDSNRVTTVESLRHRHSLKQLEFVLTSETPFADLAEEIRNHNDFGGAGVHDISIVVQSSSSIRINWDDAKSLFAALGELTQLQSITLTGLSEFPLCRLTQLLTHIQRARSLRSIHVRNVQFATTCSSTGSKQQEAIELVAALVHLKRLHQFEWQERIMDNNSCSVLKQNFYIWNVIFRQSQLEYVCLQETSGQPSSTTNTILGQIVRRDAVEKLCDSPRLEELTLFHFCIGAHALTGMAHKLCTNRNLRVLNLDLRFTGPPGIMALWNMLQTNESINTCELWIPSGSTASLPHLAQCLTRNTTLLVLVLKSSNTSAICAVSDKDARAFVTLLEGNPFGPITLDLDQYTGQYAPLIQLHTHLNVERNTDESLVLAASPETVTQTIWNWLLLTAVTAEKPVSSLYRFNAMFQILLQYPTVMTDWNTIDAMA